MHSLFLPFDRVQGRQDPDDLLVGVAQSLAAADGRWGGVLDDQPALDPRNLRGPKGWEGGAG